MPKRCGKPAIPIFRRNLNAGGRSSSDKVARNRRPENAAFSKGRMCFCRKSVLRFLAKNMRRQLSNYYP
jgi:hypothetical protein